MDPINVAIVGCGNWSEIIVAGIYGHLGELARVVATVDARPERAERLATRLGARAYTSLESALAELPIAAVDVRVPHHLHAEVARVAIAHRKHVLVEKPLATTLADAEELVAAARDANVVLSVAENYSFMESVHTARRLLDEGAIGQPLAVRTTRAYQIGTPQGGWLRDGWRKDFRRAGGVLLDQGTHQVNILRRIAGEIVRVHAYSDQVPREQAEDTVVVNCRFASGLIGQQLYCWNTDTPAPGPELVCYGTRGSIEIHVTYDAPGSGALLLRPDLPGGREWVVRGGDYNSSALPTVEDWLRACRGEKAPAMPGSEGLQDLRVVFAIFRSLETGCEVAVES